MIGAERVSRLEDFAYGVEDRFNLWWREDEKPRSYWDVPTSTTSAVEGTPSASAVADGPVLPPFSPSSVGPLHKSMSATGDGIWVPVIDPAQPNAPAVIKKTLIHPDAKRPWAELFVIAVDLRVADLHAVAGTVEPQAITAAGRAYQRSGVIPEERHDGLLVAFNGGFKRTHGRWGMRIDDVTLIPPRRHGCALLKHSDGALQIHPYMAKTEDDELLGKAVWWRQTPPCMFHEGKRHGGLWDPDSKGWGAALEGDTVIRRSAIGLDAAKTTLFVGVSNHTAAQIMANGMRELVIPQDCDLPAQRQRHARRRAAIRGLQSRRRRVHLRAVPARLLLPGPQAVKSRLAASSRCMGKTAPRLAWGIAERRAATFS